MTQNALFYEDFRESIRHLVGALGGPKKVGGMLRPTMTVKQAESWVNDCLNTDRVSKFDLEDVAALLRAGREAGVHCAMHQLADETGYVRPEIAPARTPMQELAAEYERTVAKLRQLADEHAAISKDQTMAEIRSIGAKP